MALVGSALEHRGAVLGAVVDCEHQEQQVVVGPLEVGSGRQDHVGEAGGLVQVEVDRDHELELGEGGLESAAVRGGQHRVAGRGDERLDLPGSGRVDLLGEGGRRELASELREASDPAPTPVVAARLADHGEHRHDVDGRGGEHRATRFVEVAGDGVEGDEQPRAQPAELLSAEPDPSVEHGPRRGRQLAGQPADGVGIDPSGGGGGLGRETCGRGAQVVELGHRPGRAAPGLR